VKEIPVNVTVGGYDYEIGYIKPWGDDPQNFDGWLEETSGGVVDELVVNGAPEQWTRYRVLARYTETLMAEINATEGKGRPPHAITIEHASSRLRGAAKAMNAALTAHLADIM
jgi:hypothetical protein